MKTLQSKDLKFRNRADILQLISRGSRSRADIASELGISKPAVSSIVEELVGEGLVLERGRGQSQANGGRRPILLKLNSDAGLIVAVYFNESWYEIAIVDLSAKVLMHEKENTRLGWDYRQTLDDVVATIRQSIESLQRQGVRQRVLACGIAIKGLVNTEEGQMLYSSGIPHWKDVPVRDYVAEALEVPVYVENDARAMTYAELLYGGSRDLKTSACVSVSRGIGTGIVIQNEVYRGAYDVAVTFGHTTVAENGPLCRCGNYGCWEALASTDAFLRELGNQYPSHEGIDFSEALKKFYDGEERVREVLLGYTGYWLGVGIANILNAFNPEKLIVQGTVTQAGEALLNRIQEVVRRRALPIPGTAQVSFSELTEQVEVKGAAAVVIKRFFSEEDHHKIWQPGRLAEEALL